ncbi:PhoH family protein [Pelagibacteraceae bacterium]|nr:PhoH family protein [Pelagibacteraceae bacterium]
MKTNKINTLTEQSFDLNKNSTVLYIENDYALDIFGINNENLDFIEELLPLKIFQKGNQLQIKGEKKLRNLLSNTIFQTLEEIKNKKNKSVNNLMQENIKMSLSNEPENIKKFAVAKTTKCDITGKSKNQNDYLEILQKKQIIFAIGPAGTGKTFLAVAAAVSQLLDGQFDRIILSRPAVEAGEKLGFLPGDLKEKVDPYLRPLYDSLNDLMPGDVVLRKMQSSEIEIAPLAFMRGRTLNNSFVILDEAQNATHTQIKMFLTRCGKNSRMVVTGDPSQIDLSKKSDSGLLKSIKILENIKDIEIISFDRNDIVRDEMVTKIIEAYDNHDEQISDLFSTNE